MIGGCYKVQSDYDASIHEWTRRCVILKETIMMIMSSLMLLICYDQLHQHHRGVFSYRAQGWSFYLFSLHLRQALCLFFLILKFDKQKRKLEQREKKTINLMKLFVTVAQRPVVRRNWWSMRGLSVGRVVLPRIIKRILGLKNVSLQSRPQLAITSTILLDCYTSPCWDVHSKCDHTFMSTMAMCNSPTG